MTVDLDDTSRSRSLTIGVLALQGDFREHISALTRCGVTARAVRRPADLDGLDGIVLPGGESTTIAKLATKFGLTEPLTAALRTGLPAYGSCAGMILLADEVVDAMPGQHTFGGLDLVVRRNAFGRQADSFEAEVDVQGISGGPLPAVFIRAPWVERLGADVQVLGSVAQPGTTPKVIAVRQGPLLATAFHPEVTDDLRVHRFFLELVSESR